MESKHELVKRSNPNQYEFHVDGKIAKIEYMYGRDRIFLTHTEVPDSLEGQGIGSALVKAVLEDISKGDRALVPLCPFVAAYIKKHPKWKSLVFKGIKIE